MKIYGLIGRPLSHSYSVEYFREKFRKESLEDIAYRNYEIEHPSIVRDLVNGTPGLSGLNVTIPYKVDIIPFLDELEGEAAAAGAVNCIKIFRDKGGIILKGFNTDIAAFRLALLEKAGTPESAVILGSGGAARAVAEALKSMGIEPGCISRSGPLTYENIPHGLIATHKLIVQATPLGMFPLVERKPEIPYEEIGPEHVLFDLVYNPSTTQFMTEGIARGAKVINGYRMFILQAEQSWRIWNDKYAEQPGSP